MGRRVKIGVLGGTFDPPHVGHLIVAEQARAQLGLDQVWFTPVGQPPHKQDRDVSCAEDRVVMTRLAIADNPYFVLCMDDVIRPGPHYTLTLIHQLQRKYVEHTWYLIIGGDSLVDMPKWHQPTQLVELVRLAVAHRPGSQPNITQLEGAIPNLRDRIDWIHSPLVHVSSSDLRQRFAAGLPLRYAVPDAVIDYITTQRCYQSNHQINLQH